MVSLVVHLLPCSKQPLSDSKLHPTDPQTVVTEVQITQLLCRKNGSRFYL